MGSDPLLEVLRAHAEILKAKGTISDFKLNEVLFAARDVSRMFFEQTAPTLKGLARGAMTLYASANDKALAISKSVASGLERAGDVPPGVPVIVPGVIETIDITDANTGFFSTNHTSFAERGHIVEDLRLLFEKGKQPPDVRFGVFKVRGNAPNLYWHYLKN